MAVAIESRYSDVVHPLHAVLLAGTVWLFACATLSDVAYASSYQIQWLDFASWLIVGGLITSGVALIFATVDLTRAQRRTKSFGVYAVILLATWVIGFFNALMHARDAWGSMPGGLVLSVIVTLLAAVATWFGFATPHLRGLK